MTLGPSPRYTCPYSPEPGASCVGGNDVLFFIESWRLRLTTTTASAIAATSATPPTAAPIAMTGKPPPPPDPPGAAPWLRLSPLGFPFTPPATVAVALATPVEGAAVGAPVVGAFPVVAVAALPVVAVAARVAPVALGACDEAAGFVVTGAAVVAGLALVACAPPVVEPGATPVVAGFEDVCAGAGPVVAVAALPVVAVAALDVTAGTPVVAGVVFGAADVTGTLPVVTTAVEGEAGAADVTGAPPVVAGGDVTAGGTLVGAADVAATPVSVGAADVAATPVSVGAAEVATTPVSVGAADVATPVSVGTGAPVVGDCGTVEGCWTHEPSSARMYPGLHTQLMRSESAISKSREHGMQSGAPPRGAIEAASQGVTTLRLQKLPMGQASQKSLLRYIPSAQMHLVIASVPGPSVVLICGQFMQPVCPNMGWYCPPCTLR
eukprot:Opistho-1_new@97368